MYYRDEITAGAELLMHKIKMYRPKIVAFNGRGIIVFFNLKKIRGANGVTRKYFQLSHCS